MAVLGSSADPRSPSCLDPRTAMCGALADLERALDAAREGGGERAATRHHARGKLLARERIELLVDRDSPLLELSPVAGWGTDTPVGAAVVTGIGAVEDRPCVLIANDPTVRSGALTASHCGRSNGRCGSHANSTYRRCTDRGGRAGSGRPAGAVPGHRLDAGRAGGAQRGPHPHRRRLFRPAWAAADVGCFDSTVALRGHPAAGHAEQVAEDDGDALRLARACVARLPGPVMEPLRTSPPTYDVEDLLGVPPSDVAEILGRILDGSEFDEVQPGRGSEVCAGWGRIHGHPVGVIAETTGPVRPVESRKACRLLRQAAMTAPGHPSATGPGPPAPGGDRDGRGRDRGAVDHGTDRRLVRGAAVNLSPVSASPGRTPGPP